MADRNRDFLSDLFSTLAERSRRLLGRAANGDAEVPAKSLADALLSTRGEASGVAVARALLERWKAMSADERISWFRMLAEDLGPDSEALERAIAAWSEEKTPENASALHRAAEPRRQELFRRMNLAPGGTATLVGMRELLLDALKAHPEFAPVDRDFEHLFASWFNRGFLILKRIDWSSPADMLEKIIRYEAVHEIRNWNDLRGRLKPSDRRCFAFFHPQMPDDPLVFVEVALTRGMPADIASVIAEDRQPISDRDADSAVFYSISNTQNGLRGISFGNFLIKQVVEELLRELPRLKCFVTLSPVPGFAAWLAAERETLAQGRIAPQLYELLEVENWHETPESRSAIQPLLERAVAVYLLEAKNPQGKPADAVARFHLNNGAQLERINGFADLSRKGLKQSHGVMVNYLYALDAIERNHELYANRNEVAASAPVRKLAAAENGKARARSLQALLPPRGGGKAEAAG